MSFNYNFKQISLSYRRTPKHKVQKLDIDITLISRSLSHGDWCLCYNLIKNMDSVTYAEWMAHMTILLRSACPDYTIY